MKNTLNAKQLILGCFLAISASSASAATIVYNDFSDTSALTLNGVTGSLTPNTDNHLRLTDGLGQSGSAFLSNSISLDFNASFSTAFSFIIANPVGASDVDGQGADGITFVVQTVANTAGGSGGGIGYSGIDNSVAVEFDTWNNGARDDNSGNHVGIDLNGDVDSVVQTSIATRMNNGAEWFAWVDYNGGNNLFEVRLAEVDSRPGAALLSLTTDLASVLGSNDAFIGFTSGTGAAGGQHNIVSWTLNDSFEPIGVSAPASAILLISGLFGLRILRKK